MQHDHVMNIVFTALNKTYDWAPQGIYLDDVLA